MRGEERRRGEDERRSGLDFNVVRVSVSDPWRELVPQ